MFDGSRRDKRGRWLPGHCPNPNGRPRKQPEISDADLGWFKDRIVPVTINGVEMKLTRHELLLHRMFEQAINGSSVRLRLELLKRFDDVDMLRAKALGVLEKDKAELLEKYYQTGELNERKAQEFLELANLVYYGKPPKIKKPRTRKQQRERVPFRKGPKPQSLLDLEAREEAELRALEAAENAQSASEEIPTDDDTKIGES